MNTLKISLALALLSGAQLFAQTPLAKPIALNKTITIAAPVKVVPVTRKVNPLYARAADRKIIFLDDEGTDTQRPAGIHANVAEIKAFPNPFTTQIDVIITDGAMNKSVYKAHLYDINGKRVFSETLNNNQSSLQLAQLSAGMYFLHIEKNGTVIKQEKFVKE